MSSSSAELISHVGRYAQIVQPGRVQLFNPITRNFFVISTWPEASPLTIDPNDPGGQTVEQGVSGDRDCPIVVSDDDNGLDQVRSTDVAAAGHENNEGRSKPMKEKEIIVIQDDVNEDYVLFDVEKFLNDPGPRYIGWPTCLYLDGFTGEYTDRAPVDWDEELLLALNSHEAAATFEPEYGRLETENVDTVEATIEPGQNQPEKVETENANTVEATIELGQDQLDVDKAQTVEAAIEPEQAQHEQLETENANTVEATIELGQDQLEIDKAHTVEATIEPKYNQSETDDADNVDAVELQHKQLETENAHTVEAVVESEHNQLETHGTDVAEATDELEEKHLETENANTVETTIQPEQEQLETENADTAEAAIESEHDQLEAHDTDVAEATNELKEKHLETENADLVETTNRPEQEHLEPENAPIATATIEHEEDRLEPENADVGEAVAESEQLQLGIGNAHADEATVDPRQPPSEAEIEAELSSAQTSDEDDAATEATLEDLEDGIADADETVIEPDEDQLKIEVCPYKLLRLECSHFCKLCREYHRCFICWMLTYPDVSILELSSNDECPYCCRQAQISGHRDIRREGHASYLEALEESQQWSDLAPEFQPKCHHERRMFRQIRSDAASNTLTGDAYEAWMRELFLQSLQEAKLVAAAQNEAVMTPSVRLARLALRAAHAQNTPSPAPSSEPMHNTGPSNYPSHSSNPEHSSFSTQEDQLSNYSESQATSPQPSSITRGPHQASRAQEEAASSSNLDAMPGRRSKNRVQKHAQPAGSSRITQQAQLPPHNQDQVTSALTSVLARETQSSPVVTEESGQTRDASQSNMMQAANEGDLALVENVGQSCPYCMRLDHEEGMIVCSNNHETGANENGDAEGSEKEITEEVWSHYSCAGLTASEAESIPKWYCWSCIDGCDYPETYDRMAGRLRRVRALKQRRDQSEGARNKASASDDEEARKSAREKTDSSDSDSGNDGPSKGQPGIKRGAKRVPKSKGKKRGRVTASSDDEPRKTYGKGRDSSDSDSDDYGTSKGQARAKRVKRSSQQSAKTQNKGASQDHAPSRQAGGMQKRQTKGWGEQESQHVHTLMQNLMQNDPTVAKTEERWHVISQQLKAVYNIDRSWSSVKNYWNRKGRLATGLDERRKQDPSRLVTGHQDPAQRRKARQAKMGLGGGIDDEEDEEDEYDGIEEDEYEGDGEDDSQYDESADEQDNGQNDEQNDEESEKEGSEDKGEQERDQDGGKDGGQENEQEDGQNASENDEENGEQTGKEDGEGAMAKKRAHGAGSSSDEEAAGGEAPPQKRRKL